MGRIIVTTTEESNVHFSISPNDSIKRPFIILKTNNHETEVVIMNNSWFFVLAGPVFWRVLLPDDTRVRAMGDYISFQESAPVSRSHVGRGGSGFGRVGVAASPKTRSEPARSRNWNIWSGWFFRGLRFFSLRSYSQLYAIYGCLQWHAEAFPPCSSSSFFRLAQRVRSTPVTTIFVSFNFELLWSRDISSDIFAAAEVAIVALRTKRKWPKAIAKCIGNYFSAFRTSISIFWKKKDKVPMNVQRLLSEYSATHLCNFGFLSSKSSKSIVKFSSDYLKLGRCYFIQINCCAFFFL